MIENSTSVGGELQHRPGNQGPGGYRSGAKGRKASGLDSWSEDGTPGLARVIPLPAGQSVPATSATRFANDLCAAVPDLRRIARRLVSQDCLADDLVQLTCMRALERRDQFLMGTNLVGWLSTILRNLHRDELRRRRYQVSLEAQLGDLSGPAADLRRDESPPWSDLGAEDVRQASAALPEEMRDAYLLYTFGGLSYVAIAAKLGVPMATVATRLYRARIKLREILTAQLGLSPSHHVSHPSHPHEDARASKCSS
jgi:RNA polymerase sigma-70 factor, ECF subfamily